MKTVVSIFTILVTFFFCQASAICRKAPANYKLVTSGTCESNGYLPIANPALCTEAGSSMGWKWTWNLNKLSSYKDVVDGCSFRDGHSLFVQANGVCEVGHPTPDWIPLVKKKATCKCSAFQPCVCIPRYELLKEQSCESVGSSAIFDSSICLRGAKKVFPPGPSWIPTHMNRAEPDGCIVFRNRNVWLQKKGTCTLPWRCGCSNEYACICERKYMPVYSKTCESHGLKTIFNVEKCNKAFAYLKWTFIWSTSYLSQYGDVVDGCSRRSNGSMFTQRKGGCKQGSCQCTKRQPCVCEL